MPNPKRLGPAEILKLPVVEVKDGSGATYTVYLDEKSNPKVGYLPDGNGDFTAAILPDDAVSGLNASGVSPARPEKKRPIEDDGEKPKEKKKRVNKDGGPDDAKKEKERKPLTKKQKIWYSAGIILAAILLYAFFSSGILSLGGKAEPTASSPPETEPVNVADLAAASSYEVLVVSRNMYRGEKIKAEDLTTCVVSKAEFASCGGAYTKECLSSVVGMEIVKFLPFGTLLTFDSCSFPTSYSTTPWGTLGAGREYLDIPFNVDIKNINNFISGDNVKLILKVETTQKERNSSDNTNIDGMQYSTSLSASTTTDTYEFASIQIVDVLDADRKSIYEKYSGLYSVPVGFIGSVLRQDYDAKNISRLLPAYYRIVVTSEQKKAIGDLSKGVVTVSMELLSHADATTYPVAGYLELTEYISNAVIARYNAIQTEIEEAAKNG